jgi:hypothetical protein
MDNWQPLTDIWDEYSMKLDSIEEADLAEEIIYPYQLTMGELEKEDIKQFVTDRMTEMFEYAQRSGGVNLHWISGFLFKSLITGMMWERERVGK